MKMGASWVIEIKRLSVKVPLESWMVGLRYPESIYRSFWKTKYRDFGCRCGASMTTLKKHGGWKSSSVSDYVWCGRRAICSIFYGSWSIDDDSFIGAGAVVHQWIVNKIKEGKTLRYCCTVKTVNRSLFRLKHIQWYHGSQFLLHCHHGHDCRVQMMNSILNGFQA